METTAMAPETANANPSLYVLDSPEFDIKFPFSGQVVTHRLRRPSKHIRAGGKMINEYAEWLKLVTYQSKPFDKQHNTVISDSTAADQWLWDRLALKIQGYPDMGEEWIDVTPEIARRMRGTHKEHAISLMYEGTAEILPERTKLTFDGGVWCVRLDIGPDGEAAFQIEFTCREWEEKERRKFGRDSHTVLTSKDKEGMTVVSSLDASETLFDALFISCDGATVAGQQFTGQRETFLAAIDPYWKYKIVTVLSRRWNEDRRD